MATKIPVSNPNAPDYSSVYSAGLKISNFSELFLLAGRTAHRAGFEVVYPDDPIAQTRYIFYATDSTRQSEVTIANMIVFMTWGIAPLLGVGVLRLTESIQFQIASMPFDHYDLLFAINALLFLIPHWLRGKLGLMKETPTAQVMVFVLRPLINLFGPFAQLGKKPDREKEK